MNIETPAIKAIRVSEVQQIQSTKTCLSDCQISVQSKIYLFLTQHRIQ